MFLFSSSGIVFLILSQCSYSILSAAEGEIDENEWLCADETCKEPIALAVVGKPYNRDDHRKISVKKGDKLHILQKPVDPEKKLMFVESLVTKHRGLLPKSFFRESQIFVGEDALQRVMLKPVEEAKPNINPSATTTVIDGTTIYNDEPSIGYPYEPTSLPGQPKEIPASPTVVQSTTPPSILPDEPTSDTTGGTSAESPDEPSSAAAVASSSEVLTDKSSSPFESVDMGIVSTPASTIGSSKPTITPEIPKEADIVAPTVRVPLSTDSPIDQSQGPDVLTPGDNDGGSNDKDKETEKSQEESGSIAGIVRSIWTYGSGDKIEDNEVQSDSDLHDEPNASVVGTDQDQPTENKSGQKPVADDLGTKVIGEKADTADSEVPLKTEISSDDNQQTMTTTSEIMGDSQSDQVTSNVEIKDDPNLKVNSESGSAPGKNVELAQNATKSDEGAIDGEPTNEPSSYVQVGGEEYNSSGEIPFTDTQHGSEKSDDKLPTSVGSEETERAVDPEALAEPPIRKVETLPQSNHTSESSHDGFDDDQVEEVMADYGESEFKLPSKAELVPDSKRYASISNQGLNQETVAKPSDWKPFVEERFAQSATKDPAAEPSPVGDVSVETAGTPSPVENVTQEPVTEPPSSFGESMRNSKFMNEPSNFIFKTPMEFVDPRVVASGEVLSTSSPSVNDLPPATEVPPNEVPPTTDIPPNEVPRTTEVPSNEVPPPTEGSSNEIRPTTEAVSVDVPPISEAPSNEVPSIIDAHTNDVPLILATSSEVPPTTNAPSNEVPANIDSSSQGEAEPPLQQVTQPNQNEYEAQQTPEEETSEPWYSGVISVFSSLQDTVSGSSPEPQQDRPSDSSSRYTPETAPVESKETCTSESCPPVHEDASDAYGFLSDYIDILPPQSTIFMIVTAVAIVFFSLGHYYLENLRRDVELVSKCNDLAGKLFIEQKEKEMLAEQLVTANESMTQISFDTTKYDNEISELKTLVQKYKEEKAAVEEKEKETNRKYIMVDKNYNELRKILSQNKQKGERSALIVDIKNLKDSIAANNIEIASLKEQLTEKKDEMKTLNAKVMEYMETNKQLERNVENAISDGHETAQKYQENIAKLEKTIEENLTARVKLEQECMSLKKEKESLAIEKELAESSLQKFQKLTPSKSLSEWLDAKNIRVAHLAAEKKVKELTQENEDLAREKNQLEEIRTMLLADLDQLNEKYEKAEKDKIEALTRLQVLSDYFKEKETQLQEELGSKEALWLQKQSDDRTIYEQMRALREENASFKNQNEALKREILEQEASFKKLITSAEEKAHENWVASRHLERRLKEAQMETSQLRGRLSTMGASGDNSDVSNKVGEVNGDVPPFGSATSPPFMLYSEFVPPPPLLTSAPSRPPPLGRISSPPLGDFTPPPPLVPYDMFLPPSPPPPVPHVLHKPQPLDGSHRTQKNSQSSNHSSESMPEKPRRNKR